MSISSVGTNHNLGITFPTTSPFSPSSPVGAATQPVSGGNSFKSDFASLLSAVQSGDMSTAQEALAQVQSDMSAQSGTYSPQGQTQAQVPTDLQALFSAVQSGDTSGAQQALTKLQSDSQAAGGAHGHHHHHHHAAAPAPATTTADSTDPTSTSSDSLTPDL